MNSLDLPNSSLVKNVTIITRMRGTDKFSKNNKIAKTLNNLNDSKSTINKSKTTQIKTNKSTPKLINNKIRDNVNYTMFTSNDSSNTMIVSKKPIKGSTINEALKVCDNLYDFHNSILNETSLLEYDKIYNETHSIEKIYDEIIKDNISQLFHKKNCCVLFFGPSSGGKSYLLRGENSVNEEKIAYKNKYYSNINNNINRKNKDDKKLEGGLLKRSINNILNLIKINQQGNDNVSNVKNKYELRISIYQIYMDKIYDLLSKEINNISIQKYIDDEKNIIINLTGLTEMEIRTIQDYDKILNDIENNKKNISQVSKVKTLNKDSHLVISLKLQKKIQNTVGSNVTDNYSTNSFSQIDFVELVKSDVGLSENFQNQNEMSYEYNLYSNTKDTYNSLCENIICANNGTTPTKESMLTLSLKNSLKPNSNIIFFNCVIPWEFPLYHSFKALKFTTWLRNQIINEVENIDNNISLNSNVNQYIKNNYSNIQNNNSLFNTINDTNNSYTYPNTNNSYLINNYKNPINNNNSYINNKTFPQINTLIGQSIDNGNKQNNIIISEEQNEDNNFNMNEEQNIRLIRSRSGGLNINNNNNKSYELNNPQSISNLNKNNNISQVLENSNQNNKSQIIIKDNLIGNEKTLQTLEQTLKELEDKKLEIENKMREQRNKNNYNSYTKDIPTKQNSINIEDQRLKEEQDILKSDNIIMREDISRLSETNQNLEKEISQNRDIISQLQLENQKLNEENLLLKTRLNDYDNQNYSLLYLNGQISKEDFMQKSFNERYLLQTKLKDLENNYNNLQKEKAQYEVDYRVLLSKYEEIKEKYEKCNNELLNSRQIHNNELYNIDNKINELSKEVEKLQKENCELRQDNEKQRNILNVMSSEKDMYKEKYEEKNYENNLLNKKIFEVEKGYNDIMKEKEYERYHKRQKEENHRNKSETKNKIAQELQNKIRQYRRERLQYKNNEDFD